MGERAEGAGWGEGLGEQGWGSRAREQGWGTGLGEQGLGQGLEVGASGVRALYLRRQIIFRCKSQGRAREKMGRGCEST